MAWVSGLNSPQNMVIYDNYIYVTNLYNGTISKIDLVTGAIIDSNWASELNSPYCPAIYKGFMYISNLFNGTISKINLTNGTIVNSNWASGLINPTGLIIYDDHIYVACLSTISKISIIDGTINLTWATGLNHAIGLGIHEGYIYVSNSSNGTISKINLDDGTVINNWITLDIVLYGLTIYENFMYVSLGTNNICKIKINVDSGTVINMAWASNLSGPNGLIIDGQYIYVATYLDGSISGSIYRLLLIPIVPICFPRGTPIKTDQGIIPIDKIDNTLHSINKKPIVSITQTISNEQYLICFEKHSLGYNYPSQRTIMSKQHKVLFKGEMISACTFVGLFNNINRIKYNGELLYNVLMENHNTMIVNNLICETLDPNHRIAKLYSNKI